MVVIEETNRLAELTASLTVVGIGLGRVPDALIEDTEEKRTFFVRIGDRINDLVVESIESNGVVVSYEGQETLLQ